MATATFDNVYYQRTVASAKPCYICHRPTTVVLSTIANADFIYTCATHLTDPGFATPLSDPAPKASEAEIKKIAEEWEKKERAKKEKLRQKEKEKEEGKTEAVKDANEGDLKTKTPVPKPSALSQVPSAPSHPRFVLHRQIFAMRQVEHRKRRQAARVKQVAPTLPSVPRGV